MKTSIIILTYNKLDYTKKCIDSIRKYTTLGTYEIIVVDNNSTDGTVDWLKSQTDIRLILNIENLGFPKGCNQGIKIANGDILLLNNDVVVSHNWLDNLIKCLYSSDEIGAVGPVTNYCANLQAIPATYNNDLYKMHEFSKKFNISNPLKWEERLRLIGFCMLIKRKVIEKIGLLDEIFTPGNYEDDDYSLRMRNEGFRLFLSNDTFVHHYGSVSFVNNSTNYIQVNEINRKKFISKWGIDSTNIAEIRKDITELIKNTKLSNPNIIHIGCKAGGTLLDIKNRLPESNLYGIERKENIIGNIEHFAKINIGDLKKIRKYPKSFFDYIIITISDKTTEKYFKYLLNIKSYLKNSGAIILSLPKNFNIQDALNHKNTKKILSEFSYRTHPTPLDTLLYLQISYKKNLAEANELMDKQKNEEAIVYFKDFLDSKEGSIEDNISVCNKLAEIYQQLGEYENSRLYVYKSFEYDIPYPEFCCRLGYQFREKNDLKKAIFWYRLATQLEHEHKYLDSHQQAYLTWIPHLQLCVCHYRKGDYEIAYHHNEIARSYKPDDNGILHNKELLESILKITPKQK